jgi:8-oxo-dGTP pyrophosphatase MutT (NUDIX family)
MVWPVHIVAVGGLVYNKKGEVLVARSIRKKTWTFLGGQVEVGENLEDALKREIYEESGIKVTVRKLVGIYSNVQQTTWHDGKTLVPTKITLDFICDYVEGNVRVSNETSEVKWVKPSEAIELFTHPVFSLRLNNFLTFKGDIFYHSFTSQPYKHLFMNKF